jgi:hypothetical protein
MKAGDEPKFPEIFEDITAWLQAHPSGQGGQDSLSSIYGHGHGEGQGEGEGERQGEGEGEGQGERQQQTAAQERRASLRKKKRT